MRRPYAVGVAILTTLLLSGAMGAEWVDVGTEGATTTRVSRVTNSPIDVPISGLPSVNSGPPSPMSSDGMPLDYIDLFPTGTGGNYIPWWG